MVINPTSNQEDTGLLPVLAQWVKDPASPRVDMWVADIVQTWHRHDCGIGQGSGPKKTKKKKKKKVNKCIKELAHLLFLKMGMIGKLVIGV